MEQGRSSARAIASKIVSPEAETLCEVLIAAITVFTTSSEATAYDF
jgi:hypothetical protein